MDKDEVDRILACHEFRCAWNWDSYWDVAYDRTGKKIWTRLLTCLRCDCTQTQRKPPRIEAEITSRSYYRSPKWKAVGQIYFHQAGVVRIKNQKKARGIK